MKKTLYIVDLFSFIFRAYYAIRPLNAPDGTPVNAVYGVASMLKKLIEQKKPDHLVVCLESKEKKNFREEIYPEYKANRAAPPEDLAPQIGLIEEFVRAYPMAILSSPGFEADDVIATLVKKYSHQGVDVYVVTSDKDLMQLVDGHVFLYDTVKDKVLGRDDVIEKFGVPPEKVVDVQSLCGDPTDNVPGIRGVGPKTAAKLIQEYGSLEAVLERARGVKGKLGESLVAGREAALLSRRLVALNDDVPLDVHWRDLEFKKPDAEKLAAFYKRLGFRTMLAELGAATPSLPERGRDDDTRREATAKAHPVSEPRFVTVASLDELKAALEPVRKEKRPLAFDTETDSLNAHEAKLVGLSFCHEPGEAFYVPIAHKEGPNLPLDGVKKILAPLLEATDPQKIAQNAKFDINVLVAHGFEIAGLEHDTLIASHLADPEGAHDLDTLAARYLSHDMLAYGDVVKKGQDFSDVDVVTATRYAAEDAWAAFCLAGRLAEDLKQTGVEKVYRDVEIPLVPILAEMERTGILVDKALLRKLGAQFGKKLAELEKDVHAAAGESFNVNSPKQLAAILFGKLGLPVVKKTKTGPSTDVDVLSELAPRHDLPRLLLEYRTIAKLKSTYVDQLEGLIRPATGRIHTSFNQAVVATGRLSSTSPNLQNIPIKTPEGRRIREVFVAPEGHVIVSADYSQIELRLLAAFSGDPGLIEAYREKQDIHRRTAARLFGVKPGEATAEQRAVGKTVNFGVIYGQSPFGLARQLGVPQQEAKIFITRFYEEFGRVREFRDEILEKARRDGYVTTRLGRRRYLPDLASRNQMARGNAERAAFNTIFQGSAADLIKKAMIDLHAAFQKKRLRSRMILQVHDELLFEVPTEELGEIEKIVPRLMANAFELEVPLEVNVRHGKNWGEAH